MNDLDITILEFIKKCGRRIKINFTINKLLMGLQASLILIIILLIFSLFIIFESCYKVSLILLGIAIIISIFYGYFKSPKGRQLTLIIDSKGLNERVTTSMQFKDNKSSIAESLKKDTIKTIKDFNVKKNFPININKREVYKIMVLALAAFFIMIIPTSAKKEASRGREFQAVKSENIEKINKEEKQIEKDNELEEEEKEKLQKLLEEFKRDIKDVKNEKEASKLMKRMDKKFEALKDEIKSEKGKKLLNSLKENIVEEQKKKDMNEALKNLNEIHKSFKKSDIGNEILESLKDEDSSKLEDKLKEIEKNFDKISDKEKSEFSNALLEAANNLSDTDLQNMFENASDGVLDGKMDSSQLSATLTSLKNSSQGSSKDNGGSSSTSSGGSSGEGNGNGSGSGSGSSSGSGSGSGSGAGRGLGGGYNTGSKEGKEKDEMPFSGEEVFIPGRNMGNDKNLIGDKNDAGALKQVETQKGLNIDGEKKDYNSVIGDYSKAEIESMNSSSLPENLQSVVKDYFQGLE